MNAAVGTGAAGGVDVLGTNKDVLNDKQAQMAATLLELGQSHLFEGWPAAGSKGDGKRRLMDQAMVLDSKHPGGLEAYVSKAKTLLRDAADEVNLFEGYTPRLADGESLTFGAGEFDDVEAKG